MKSNIYGNPKHICEAISSFLHIAMTAIAKEHVSRQDLRYYSGVNNRNKRRYNNTLYIYIFG